MQATDTSTPNPLFVVTAAGHLLSVYGLTLRSQQCLPIACSLGSDAVLSACVYAGVYWSGPVRSGPVRSTSPSGNLRYCNIDEGCRC